MELMDFLPAAIVLAFFFFVNWYIERKKGRIAFSLGGEQGKTIGKLKGHGGKLMTAELSIHLLHQKSGTRTVLEFTQGGRFGGGRFNLFAGFDRDEIDEIIKLLQRARNET